jgi:hypothetical protein
MAREIQTKLNSWANFTITLSSLANGSARQSTIVANTSTTTGRRRAALIFMKIESGGSAPTNGAIYEIFMLRGDDSGNRTDGAGASDAAITIQNAQLIGTLAVTATTNAFFQDMFDTAPLGQLGTEFGIAVRNSSAQALNATEGNHVKRYALYLPEIQ